MSVEMENAVPEIALRWAGRRDHLRLACQKKNEETQRMAPGIRLSLARRNENGDTSEMWMRN